MTLALFFATLRNGEPQPPEHSPRDSSLRAAATTSAAARAETDETLIRQIRAGHARAFEILFRTYHPRLVTFAASYVGSMDSAEEIVADVFAWLWEHRTTWTTTAGISAYLFGAVRNRALNVIKQRTRDVQRATAFRQVGEAPGSAAPTLELAEQIERDDFTSAALKRIAELPERRRLILSLRWKHDMTWTEIAAILGTTSAAVQMEHSRILAGLRAELRTL